MYREVILDHYKNPRGHGELEDADAHAEGQNPLCGDEVSIFVVFGEDGDTIDEVKFEGRGCAISQAATSMLTEMVQGPERDRGGGAPAGRAARRDRHPAHARSGSSARCSASSTLKLALHKAKGTPLPEEWAAPPPTST